MTSQRHLERDLPELLAGLALTQSPDYRDYVVRQTAGMPQRPAWTFPERWLPVDLTTQPALVAPFRWRQIGAFIVIVALLVATLVVVGIGSRPKLPAPPYGPARNGLVAFEQGGDIYLGDPVAGSTRLAVSGGTYDSDPRFSLDGTSLGFVRTERVLAQSLVVADADGGNSRVLTQEPLIAVSDWSWSGDGRWILVISEIKGIPTMSMVDTTSGVRFPLDVGMPVLSAEFRPPDDRQIVLTVGEASDAAIWVVDTDGMNLHRLASGGGPTYSPDGTRIAYGRSYQPEVERNETRVIGADGSNDHIVGDRPDIQYQGTAVWSPDGTRLLVFRNSRTAGMVVAAVPADGSGPGQEFDVGFSQGFGWLGWSPDGSQIVSMPADQGEKATLVNVADGSSRDVPRWYTSNWQRLAP